MVEDFPDEQVVAMVEQLFHKPTNQIFVGDLCTKDKSVELLNEEVKNFFEATYGPCKIKTAIGPLQ
jgi:hypothetical protein